MRRVALIGALVGLCGLGGCGAGGDRPPAPRGGTTLYLPGFVGKGAETKPAVTVVDVEARTTRVVELPELGIGDPEHWLVRRGDRLVFWGGDAVYSIDLAFESLPLELGSSDPFVTFTPSAHPERVWLSVHQKHSYVKTVREVTTDGRVTVPSVHPPSGASPIAAAGDYLVFDSGRGISVWDPATREVRLELPRSFAAGTAHGDVLTRCGEDGHPLHLTDVETGDDEIVPLPAGVTSFVCFDGAFSPDGEILALPVFLERGRAAEAVASGARTALALVDVDKHVASVVSGTRVRRAYVFVAWSRSGDSVFMSGGGTHRREIVEYEIGAERAQRLPVDVDDYYGMAAE